MAENNKILFIEDEENIRTMYQMWFKNAGFETYSAKDGKEGLEMAKEVKPNLILLDIRMPRYDGYWFLAKAKGEKELKGIPIVALSNLGTESEKDDILKSGASEYLWKMDWTPGTSLIEKVKDYISSTTGAKRK